MVLRASAVREESVMMGHTGQTVAARGNPSSWIQDVVVECAVLFKVPLVGAGGDNGLVFDPHGCEGDAALVKGLLDADVEGGPVRFAADGEHIAAQIDEGMVHAFPLQVFLEKICDIAFCHGSQIKGGRRVLELHGVALHHDFLVVHVLQRLGEGGLVREGPALRP